jgi:hypothetical protein
VREQAQVVVGRQRVLVAIVGSYLAVWTLIGVAIYALYRPHGTSAAGAVVIAAGLYELTPLKREFRRRCRETIRTGFEFGLFCVGSSIALMSMLVALDLMSVTWMSVIGVLILAQKLLPANRAVDVPLAPAIVGLGVLMIVAPSSAIDDDGRAIALYSCGFSGRSPLDSASLSEAALERVADLRLRDEVARSGRSGSSLPRIWARSTRRVVRFLPVLAHQTYWSSRRSVTTSPALRTSI